MPTSSEHICLTQNAISLAGGAFPEELATEYCLYPDQFFSTPIQLRPYYFGTGDVQFHYPPTVAYENLYRYWNVRGEKIFRRPFSNDNFRHVFRGFKFYFGKSLGESEGECWKYAGCLVHMLQDALFGPHTLENANGFDLDALARLGYFPQNPVDVLCAFKATQCQALAAYQPRLLGTSPDEAAANLYSEYIRKCDSSRNAAFRIIMALLEHHDEAEARQAAQSAYQNAVEATADVLHTIRVLRTHDKALIHRCAQSFAACPRYLTEFSPVETPFGGGSGAYVFSAATLNYALNRQHTAIPLELSDNQKRIQPKNGWAFGAHFSGRLLFRLPLRRYRHFSALIGFHPAGADNPTLTLTWVNNGRRGQPFTLCANQVLKMPLESPHGLFGIEMAAEIPAGVIVIGEPLLTP